ncbi:MAG: helix-turn-helix domain-containing protein [Candidatus Thiodiazotropha endolucinida]|uniref:Helix-turn-helix domain-containing protein n=1 Tax=Candidatus Thiodiazotropha taylori TaxID=2792791 RepID=A0A9E4TUX8_9GAMM|nr:helix-turn-helix domain-containing protein [Candidatus Thiodiazotropha taylori]MCW4238411.1 helix-turn-helix domain-containing protein [Candidatus Thiodiazotropha endolucinida]
MSTQELKPGTSYPAVVGGILVNLRNQQGVRQGDLAQVVGVTQATWSRIENGSSALTIEQLGLAAARLGILPGQVMELADQAVGQLRQRGVHVEPTRSAANIDSGTALIGAAALGALIAAVFLKK